MEFTPRLIQILFLLLNTEEPISAGELAEQLQISKRTIFRELDHVDRQLSKYGLVLHRKSRIGFQLTGSQEKKEELLLELESSDHFDPRNKEKRQQKLLQAILEEDKQQKLFYYADLLQVSEATISKDLEVVEEWFQKQNITVVRRAGFGIGIMYKEEDFRKALLAYQTQYQYKGFMPKEIFEKVRYIIHAMGKETIGKLTGYSAENFVLYTAVSVYRIMEKKLITEVHETHKAECRENYEFICNLAEALEKEFCISIGKSERYELYIFLQGCKLQYIQREGESVYIGDEKINIKNMVYEMANIFDPMLAYELKGDDDFVEGMIAHLQPTMTRLVHRMPIKNPMLEQIKETYPEIFRKAKEASKVMERMLSCKMPEDEIGFLALHFGGAMMRLDHKKRTRHKVDVGVVCASGIGISILMSSKLKHNFEDKIRVKALNADRIAEAEVDFLVSAFPLDVSVESVCVDPMLGEEDIEKVSKLVEKYAFREKKVPDHKKNVNVYEATLITNEINSIIKGFSFQSLKENISFEQALIEISRFFSEDVKKTEQIYKDFSKREALSTQVIEEFEIVFLHAKTSAVAESKFIIVVPEKNVFINPYFKGARAMIVMLIPEDDQRRTLAVSSISNKIFEDEDFLEEIKTQQEEKVFQKVKDILEDYFNEYLRSVYEASH